MRERLLAAVCLLANVGAAGQTPELARPTVEVAVGFRGFTRTFGTTDSSSEGFGYTGASSGVALEASYFPGAFATQGPWGNLGLFAEGQFSLGLTSTFGAAHFATSATVLRGGVTARIPSGRHGLLVQAGVESRAFRIAATSVEGVSRPTLPDVGYLGPRVGLGYRLAVTAPVSLEARVGFTWALEHGELVAARYFPGASAFALDGRLAVAFTVLPSVELRLVGDWSRYFITLGTSGAAADQSFGGGALLAITL